MALVFTTVQVRKSLYDGRLSAPPTYDDIAYLADAQARLHTLYTAGPRQALRSALEDPPHSPWSTGVAALSFMTLGVREWAPAAGNGLIILALLSGLWWRARDLPLTWQLPIAVFVLTWPLAGQAVVNFRPDIACGLATAWVGLYVTGGGWVTASGRRHYLAGAGLALALLIKPTVSPMTACVALVALVAATVTDIARGHPWRDWRPILRSWSRCVGVATLLAGPYYLWAGRSILEYVTRMTLGELKELWRLDLSWSEHALFYLSGPGGRFSLGGWLYLWLGLAFAALGLTLLRRDDASMARLPAITAVFLVTYGFITITGHKNVFLGAALPALILLSGMELMIRVARTSRAAAAVWQRRVGALMLALLAGVGLVLFGWPDRFAPWGFPKPDEVRQHRELLERVHRGVQQHGPRPARVLFTHIGPYLNPPLLRFRSGLERAPQINALDLAFSTDPNDLGAELKAASDVIVFSPDNPSSMPWLPAAGNQGRVRERLEAHPKFFLAQTLATPGGGQLFLYKRALGFHGFRPVDGLGPIEGPYPEMNLETTVRWGLGPRSLLEVDVATDSAVRLVLEGSSIVGEQTMTVLVSGQQVGGHRFVERNEFERLELDLELSPGRHPVEIRYSRWREPDGNDNRRLAVLFRALLAVEAGRVR